MFQIALRFITSNKAQTVLIIAGICIGVSVQIFMPLKLSGKNINNQDTKDAEDLLKRMDILSIKDKRTNKISGGQRQRTAIARALMNKPSIVLADEPTGNLDSINSKTVFELFDGINKDFGTTFLIITHDENIASKVDNRFEIKDGKVS